MAPHPPLPLGYDFPVDAGTTRRRGDPRRPAGRGPPGAPLWAAALALVAAACGRLGYDSEFVTCDWRDGVQLSAPAHLAELATPVDEVDPFLTADGLTLYFASNRAGPFDIYAATRPRQGASFGPPARIPESSEGDDFSFGVSTDGRVGYLASDRPGGPGGVSIWLGVRDDPGAPFADLWSLGISSPGDDYDPMLTADERVLWLAPASPEDDPRPQDLHLARRNGASWVFSRPERVEELSSDAGEADPSLSDDQLVIVFATSRRGARELWYAVRDDADEPFGAPAPIPDINSGFGDSQPFLRGDGCELFFSSRRPGGSGQNDLYRAVFLR
jgi:hypothetical protein